MKKILIFLTLVTFFIYEVDSMRYMALASFGVNSNEVWAILSFFVCLLLSIAGLRVKTTNIAFSKSIFVLFIYIYIISIIYGFIIPLGADKYFKIILPLLVFIFMKHASYQESGRKILKILFIPFFIGLALYYYVYLKFNLAFSDSDMYYANTSYYILYFAPLLLFYKNPSIRFSTIAITILIVLSSLKRGGTIALFMGVLSYLWVDNKTQNKQQNRTVKLVRLLLSLTIVGFFVFVGLSESGEYLMQRFVEADDASERGRITIYNTVLGMIANSNPIQFVFGHGWNQVMVDNPIQMSSHNDYLETIYDFGVIGFILLLVYLYQAIKYSIFLIRRKSIYAASMVFAIVVLVVNSFVSHILIYTQFMVIFAALFGYIVGAETDLNNLNKATTIY